ncbi:type I secretion system permease/ATPase [Phaeobacter piscinae]|uniref:type I secretion system permease/ATPase n=1 Tax=Phaeobacter piscinae TaxID=1580596 RepID=UPI00058FCC77|nr:type I secretion system permease/ATPase [Phaeobacter piscinae]UTS82943.1 Type I secretion system ATP-binding protein PrsD [Phaeobacter piscinae]
MARTSAQHSGSGHKSGLGEIRKARRGNRGAFWLIGVFSFFANLLMLTSPLYMMQVYDRVLGSRSLETLVALTVLAGFLFLIMGVLDYVRGRILARVGARFHDQLETRVFNAVQDKSAAGFNDDIAKVGLRDLEAMQKALSSPIVSAFFDLPWTPLFLGLIAVFHPLLGLLALIGGAVLVVFALANQMISKAAVENASMMAASAHQVSDGMRNNAELIQGLGMRRAAFAKWRMLRSQAVGSELSAADMTGGFSTATRTFRLALQSAMLGTGAYLVLTEGLTPGVMIASSIIMGRALAPIETLIGQWALVQRAMQAQERLAQMLTETPERPAPMKLARPAAKLEVQGVALVPPVAPGQVAKPALQGLNFNLQPGQALGVIGASGAGKSSLARALIGVWHPVSGKIRLDGAALNQYDMDDLGSYIGYLPQQVTLFDGTIAENIARLSMMPDPDQVVAAARKAAVHDMILTLPQGYDTPVRVASNRLSGGQVQRIGLARALYGDPVLLVLDEPNSNLDNEGSQALNLAVSHAKKDGRAVIIMAHRPAAIQLCDLILILDNGTQRAFGPKDAVLGEHLQNPQVAQKKPAQQQAPKPAAQQQAAAPSATTPSPSTPAQSTPPQKQPAPKQAEAKS